MFNAGNLNAALRATGMEPDPALFAELDSAYGAADRHYHNRTHIADCLTLLEQHRRIAVRPDELALAIWFHDVVYDTRRGDNEEKSAEAAARALELRGARSEVVARVRELILATKHGAKPGTGPGEGEEDRAARADLDLLVDIDLEILGRPAAGFDAYDAAIRAEYAWVPEAAYRAARIAVLEGFLRQDRIYRTGFFFESAEKPARENLARVLAVLKAAS